MPKASLETLRAIFREELDDMLQLLAQQVDRASADPRGAADEVRRALHTLKGAARAAGYPELEAECHALESRAEKLRGADAEEIAAAAKGAIAALTRFVPIVQAGSAMPSGPVSIATAPAEPAPAVDTVRVDAAALARILDASEELVLDMSRGLARTSQAVTESATAELLRELDFVRGLASALEARTSSQAAGEIRRRLDRALGSARTMAAAAETRGASERVAWKTSSDRAKLVAAAARSLRQERFESLAVSATQAAESAAASTGVKLEIVREGDDVRFDRRLREPLREVLLHLVRNAVAHGIEPPRERRAAGKREQGLLSVRAEEGEGELRVIVRDDGRGIDFDAVAAKARALGIEGDPTELLFAAGLSTRAETDELAGRGVGLDVVRQRVSDLHGRVAVESERGKGTTFLVVVAPDMSLTRALVARAGPFMVAVRLSSVERILRVARSEIDVAGGRAHVLHGGALLPLASVATELGGAASALPDRDHLIAVLTRAGERRVALIVDEIADEREVAVRPLAGRFRRVAFVSGSTVLADGTLGWMLDVRALAAVARGAAPSEEAERAPAKRVLVVDDSATTRELERALLRANGFDVEVAADGEQAWLALTASAASFDVVLSDVEMPRLDGFALLGRIRSTPRLARLPVVLVTALEDPADKQRALDMGASAYIVKSAFDEEQLLDVIAHLL
ncbi:MAG: response regulator [Labilithrix sp.]|nr:response regulator [Labilithrix sp.]MCW5817468.1 response regulator [Labilithrix sp.]